MFRLATSILSPGGERGRLSAFIFHRVLPAPDPLQPSEPHAEQFDEMLGWIGSQFNVLPPLEACERLYAKSLPPRAAIITFDDGYRDNHDIAMPLLKKHGMTAVFFIATGYLDGGVMFNDRVIEAVRGAAGPTLDTGGICAGSLTITDDAARRSAIGRLLSAVKHLPPARRDESVARIEACCAASAPTDLMMKGDEVRALAAHGMELGGHTRNHPILRSLDDARASREILEGSDDLAQLLGRRPRLFAYPNGKLGDDFDRRHCGMARDAGFEFAFTTHAGCASATTDRFLVPRYTPWSRGRVRFQSQATRNLWDARAETAGA